MVFFVLALVLTPVLFLWTQDLTLLLVAAGVNAFFTQRTIFVDAGLAAGAVSDADACDRARLRVQCAALHRLPRAAARRQLIVTFGGFGPAATIIASIYALGLIAVLFLPETRGRPLPE